MKKKFRKTIPLPPLTPFLQDSSDRNAKCRCGSGKKYKHCHLRENEIEAVIKNEYNKPIEVEGKKKDDKKSP